MDFNVGIVSRNLATTSNSETVEILCFSRQWGSARHLAQFKWLKRCHVSCAELVKQGEPSGAHVDMWHLLIGWKSKVNG